MVKPPPFLPGASSPNSAYPEEASMFRGRTFPPPPKGAASAGDEKLIGPGINRMLVKGRSPGCSLT